MVVMPATLKPGTPAAAARSAILAGRDDERVLEIVKIKFPNAAHDRADRAVAQGDSAMSVRTMETIYLLSIPAVALVVWIATTFF